MSWTPREREIGAVFALPGPDRYGYCVKKIADEEVVWSLGDHDGWILLSDSDGRELVPIWPHSSFAAACAAANWPGAEPRAIPLEKWRDRWLSGIENDRRAVAVFPNLAGEGPVVEASRLNADLDDELAQYE
ncbi:MAG: DUF2750 domain-containing protein [Gemmatimonadetes bacterium]|nr:DUF2750 domain-containing protein [Gemmatimonadota bacterium]MBK8059784.1 DUF2750 domain-containing protein [Gemmatimonadota bacterium]